jgi:predicted lysophospholipase L1 biosynthesis ABC-type transport system permease subunit
MPQAVAIVLAAIGGAFVYAVLVSKGMSVPPSPNATTYYLTVAFIAFVNAALFASARTADE